MKFVLSAIHRSGALSAYVIESKMSAFTLSSVSAEPDRIVRLSIVTHEMSVFARIVGPEYPIPFAQPVAFATIPLATAFTSSCPLMMLALPWSVRAPLARRFRKRIRTFKRPLSNEARQRREFARAQTTVHLVRIGIVTFLVAIHDAVAAEVMRIADIRIVRRAVIKDMLRADSPDRAGSSRLAAL